MYTERSAGCLSLHVLQLQLLLHLSLNFALYVILHRCLRHLGRLMRAGTDKAHRTGTCARIGAHIGCRNGHLQSPGRCRGTSGK